MFLENDISFTYQSLNQHGVATMATKYKYFKCAFNKQNI
jgi:hypothetical protein